MSKRVIFTGGSGKAGRHIVNYLVKKGYDVLNLDVKTAPADVNPSVHTLRTDLTDSGQVFNALSCHFAPTEPLPPRQPAPADAVIHFAGYPEPLQVPDNETFRINVLGTYNVIEAASKLGIRKIIIASSICIYGVGYHQGTREWPYFPLDEDAPTKPTDAYGLSKVVGESIAESFAMRLGTDTYCLRIGQIFVPEEYDSSMFHSYVQEPEKWNAHGWSYSDVRDLAQMVTRGIETDGLGFQVFNAVNNTMTNYQEPNELIKRVTPNAQIRRPLTGREAPLGNAKIRNMLQFKEEWDWRSIYRSKAGDVLE